jgi:hypothetical protein
MPRYTFIASTELTDSASTVRLSARITEISRKGCYVDTLNTLPVGTPLKMKILRDSGTFITTGKTIYVHDRIGMGVAFTDSLPDQLEVLDCWLAEFSASPL